MPVHMGRDELICYIEIVERKNTLASQGAFYYKRNAQKSEAKVDILLSALDVALNSNDYYDLEGARNALIEIREEDLTLYKEVRDAEEEIERLRGHINDLEDQISDLEWLNEEREK